MVQAMLLDSLFGPLVGAVVVHIFCHRYPPESIPAFIAVLFLPPTILHFTSFLSLSVPHFVESLAVYLFFLGCSVSLYRLSPFHPLAKYPGPALARISRLWAVRHVLGGYRHKVSRELFEKYGDIVRTGPDHLIVRDASAIPVVLGAKNPWHKHGRYNVIQPYESEGGLLSLMSPSEHSKRRRIWDKAFSPAAIKSYQPLLHGRVLELVSELSARIDRPLDLAEWTGLMATDFMGDFAMGGLFSCMAQGVDHAGIHKNGDKIAILQETSGALPWLRPFVVRFIKLGGVKFREIAARSVFSRLEKGSQTRDMFYYLMNEDGEETHPPLSKNTAVGESMLALIAGSDTTGTALANAMFYLLTHPECMTRLRAELDAAAGEGSPLDVDIGTDKLSELEYLQAIINETLRLQPAVPNGVPRMPPKEGGPVVVAGCVVPVGTTVQIPTWSLHRDPRYFSPEPDAFWPERWLPEEGPKIAETRGQDFTLDQGAYMPFNYGPGNCIGRSLALHEMRAVLAALVRRFELRFAPGFRPEDWLDQLTDHFILIRAKLEVVISKRMA